MKITEGQIKELRKLVTKEVHKIVQDAKMMGKNGIFDKYITDKVGEVVRKYMKDIER